MTLSFFFKLSNHDLVLCGSVKVTDRSQPCEDITAPALDFKSGEEIAIKPAPRTKIDLESFSG